jgi:hypothetical protein
VKLTIEHEGETVTIESPAIDIWEVAEVLRRALVAVGFNPKLADEIFDRNVVDDWGLGNSGIENGELNDC